MLFPFVFAARDTARKFTWKTQQIRKIDAVEISLCQDKPHRKLRAGMLLFWPNSRYPIWVKTEVQFAAGRWQVAPTFPFIDAQ